MKRSRRLPRRRACRVRGYAIRLSPLPAFLFCGPTGVGKTALVNAFAKALQLTLHRFDMSEYMERHTVSRLIGAPPGYVGFEQGGLLTDAVDKTPHSVVLLDEIEKAHHDIFNILLQVMDYGKLTDHNGKSVDFRNTALIMTTNAGAETLSKRAIGYGRARQSRDNEEAIKKAFPPEFRNRLDAIIPFSFLDAATIERVVDKLIMELEGSITRSSGFDRAFPRARASGWRKKVSMLTWARAPWRKQSRDTLRRNWAMLFCSANCKRADTPR